MSETEGAITVNQLAASKTAASTYNLLKDAANCDLRNRGYHLFVQQLTAMLNKKFLYTIRNWLLFLSQLLIPVFFLAISLIVAQTLPGVENSKPLHIKLENYLWTTTSVELKTPHNALAKNLTEIYLAQFESPNKSEWVPENETMTDYYIDRSAKDLPGVNLHSLTGVTFASVPSLNGQQDDEKVLATGWFNNQPYHVPPLTLNLIHNAMLVHRTGDPDYRITVTNHPLPYDDLSKLNNDASSSSLGFQVGFNISFGMAFLAASFVIFLGNYLTLIVALFGSCFGLPSSLVCIEECSFVESFELAGEKVCKKKK